MNIAEWSSSVARRAHNPKVVGSNPASATNIKIPLSIMMTGIFIYTERTAYMKSIYFTRHGQTVWNVENKICGTTDIELTQLGIQQAKELGEKIKNSDYKIDMIICSPLVRAYETATYISEATGIPLKTETRLTEQNFGKYEGTARNGEEFKKSKATFANSYDGGESMLKLAQRIYNLLDELKSDDKTYLLVAHNGIARIVNSYFNDMTNDEYAKFGINNCEILRFEF